VSGSGGNLGDPETGLGKRQCTPITEGADGLPVVFMHCKPLAVPWANVDVDRAEIVVLLVACRGRQKDMTGQLS
jgi:hypothetical protein